DSIHSNSLKLQLKIATSSILDLPDLEREEEYVSAFDLRSKLGLYMTAHEFGDSNKRGAAIIQLQNMIKEAGFERVDDELADFIPMLFEYLVVSEEENERLFRRMAVAISRIRDHINSECPYAVIIYVLMDFIFPEPTKKEIHRLEFDREEADLEDLPYPIMYQ